MVIYLAPPAFASGAPSRGRVRLLPEIIPTPAGAEGESRADNPFSLFCLAPRRVYLAPSVTLGAVSSYLAISPLPPSAEASGGGIFSATLSVGGSFGYPPPSFS